jgi:hypothetical protein
MPSTTLTERFADWHQGSAIDSAARIVRNVALAGLHSRNGYRYTESALRAAAPLYDHRPVFLDHAPDPARPQVRSTRDLVGSIVHPRFEEGRIRGDIRLLDTDSARTFLALVESDAPGVGMSHVVLARRSADGGTVEAIENVLSVDAVVNPATTSTFRESADASGTESPPAPAPDAPPANSCFTDTVHLLNSHLTHLTETLHDLGERLSRLERQWDQESRQREVTALLAESRLPSYALTPGFLQQLQSAPDDASRQALLRERLELLQHVARHLPTSHSRPREHPTLDTAAFLQAFQRR